MPLDSLGIPSTTAPEQQQADAGGQRVQTVLKVCALNSGKVVSFHASKV